MLFSLPEDLARLIVRKWLFPSVLHELNLRVHRRKFEAVVDHIFRDPFEAHCVTSKGTVLKVRSTNFLLQDTLIRVSPTDICTLWKRDPDAYFWCILAGKNIEFSLMTKIGHTQYSYFICTFPFRLWPEPHALPSDWLEVFEKTTAD